MKEQAESTAPDVEGDDEGTSQWLAMPDGKQLFVRDWAKPQARDAILIVHGLGEHSGRYLHVARWLRERGYAVRSYDQRGHGRTRGQRAALRHTDNLLEDLTAVYRDYASTRSRAPLLLGHSMGGLVALRAVLDDRVRPSALILSSPALRTHEPAFMRKLARVLSVVLPNLPLRNSLKIDALSHDAKVVAAYRSDPYCSGWVTPRMADFIFRAGDACIADGWHLRIPTLLLAAGSDRLVEPSGSRDFAAAAWATKYLTSRFFDTLYHELFNESETGRHQVFAQLGEWLRRQTGS